ncbi:MAG: hypothetical protein ACPGU5_02995 [Lishizhenia sp.]
MQIKDIYITEENQFSALLSEWSERMGVQINTVGSNDNELYEKVQGIVIFHENHDISKEAEEISKDLDKSNIATHKVDINGTVTATVTNLNMWIERNSCESILVLAEKNLEKNENLHRFLEKLEASYK